MKPVLSKKHGMSLAEILVTLGTIGVISGIVLPAVVDRISDKAISAQKKAAVSILTEAVGHMSGIDGYGADDKENAAHLFIAGGLQKNLKIRTICDKDNLKNCGLPDSFLTENGSSEVLIPTNMKELYPDSNGIDSDVAGFLTINGVSVAAYYNPNCSKKEKYWDLDATINVKDKICLNMIYDVNGSKRPNKVGKDIGFVTVLYNNTPEIVAPEAASSDNSSAKPDELCRNISKAHQPNIEELASLYINKKLSVMKNESGSFISSTSADDGYILELNFSNGEIKPVKADKSGTTRCVKDANRTD